MYSMVLSFQSPKKFDLTESSMGMTDADVKMS